MEWLNQIKFDEQGLVPVIVQDAGNEAVLTLAYANATALRQTLATGESWFFSRSRQELWHKGATSGNVQKVVDIRVDCDGDSIIYRVEPCGPACHTGQESCFYRQVDPRGRLGDAPKEAPLGPHILEEVFQVIRQRQRELPPDSYVTRLTQKGLDRILQKIGEEATEVVLAGKNQEPEAITLEMADLWFHCLVALGYLEMTPQQIFTELSKRRK